MKNRGLDQTGGQDIVEKRRELAQEIRDVLRRIEVIRATDIARQGLVHGDVK